MKSTRVNELIRELEKMNDVVKMISESNIDIDELRESTEALKVQVINAVNIYACALCAERYELRQDEHFALALEELHRVKSSGDIFFIEDELLQAINIFKIQAK